MGGSYRLSARELLTRVQNARLYRNKYASSGSREPMDPYSNLDEDTKDSLERLRRGNSCLLPAKNALILENLRL